MIAPPINPRLLILIGFLLVLLGWLLPLFMVMKMVPSTIFLNFLAFGCQVLGLFLGLIGMAFTVRLRK